MGASVIWLLLMIAFAVGEAVTVGLTSIWFALGSLGGLFAAHLGAEPLVQCVVFLVLSGAALLLARPAARRLLQKNHTSTNADRVIGQTAVVTQTIDNLKASGQVSILGQSWTARSQQDVVIPAGEEVRVLRIEGVKVFVERLPGSGSPS